MRLAIVSPCHNEEEMLPHTAAALLSLLDGLTAEGRVAPESFILFVDDGSTDATWQGICSLASERVRGVSLSRRYGHQSALLAGMKEALPHCDACVTVDADLQDDISAIREMILAYEGGAEIVFGVRRDRSSDSWMKKTTAAAFYSTMSSLGVESLPNHADYRLMSARAVADLLEYGERNLFLRGLVPLLGYRQQTVEYDRLPRRAGESKYPFRKMLDFAIDGITSFSVRPVRMIFWVGIAFALTALGIGIYVLVRLFSGATIEGWASLMLSIWFCTGIMLMALGVVGEYIGKIYIEVKRRPRWHVAART